MKIHIGYCYENDKITERAVSTVQFLTLVIFFYHFGKCWFVNSKILQVFFVYLSFQFDCTILLQLKQV